MFLKIINKTVPRDHDINRILNILIFYTRNIVNTQKENFPLQHTQFSIIQGRKSHNVFTKNLTLLKSQFQKVKGKTNLNKNKNYDSIGRGENVRKKAGKHHS